MQFSYQDLKTKLISILWLPLVINGGNQLYPRLRKHKNMNLFSLTDHHIKEIIAFDENKISKRENVIAWNQSHLEAFRLETELGVSEVVCEGKFEDAIIEEGLSITNYLHCDIFNLDFLSQNPNSVGGRIENEINGTNALIGILDSIDISGFVLLYTTLLDQYELDFESLSFSPKLDSRFLNPLRQISDKVKLINQAVSSSIQDFQFQIVHSNSIVLDIKDSSDKVFSSGWVVERN